MSVSLVSLLSVGFGLGLMHAVDADHVMAVTALSNDGDKNQPQKKLALGQIVRFALHWAVGHGAVLLIAGLVLFLFGWHLPDSVQHVAELSVGAILVFAGAWFFWTTHRASRFSASQDSGEVNSTPGQVSIQAAGQMPPSGFRAFLVAKFPALKSALPQSLLVGMVHGLAGSAPALALIPALAQGQNHWALAYLLIFSLGVMIAMVSVCMSWRGLQRVLQQTHRRAFLWSRHGIAASAMLMGFYWLGQTV